MKLPLLVLTSLCSVALAQNEPKEPSEHAQKLTIRIEGFRKLQDQIETDPKSKARVKPSDRIAEIHAALAALPADAAQERLKLSWELKHRKRQERILAELKKTLKDLEDELAREEEAKK